MKEDLNILKVEYLTTCSYLNIKLQLDERTVLFKSLKCKTTSKYQKWNIPATTVWIVAYGIRGKLRGNLECGSAQPSLFIYSL